jgi:acetylornithine deacetylase
MNNIKNQIRTIDAKALLKDLVRIVSYTGEEDEAAGFLEDYMREMGLSPYRKKNNLWVFPENYSDKKANLLLNAHIDTVRPTGKWSANPHEPLETETKIQGLGTNDDGASLVCLLDTFLYYSKKDIPANVIFSATAEEENGGKNGLQSILDELPEIALGIIGEPTDMEMAVGERGLVVIDGIVGGSARHAAQENPDNAILNAMKVLDQLQNVRFEKESSVLGKVHITVSQIQAGMQHNVTPAECRFVLDIRVNEFYTPEVLVDILKEALNCKLKPRSLDKKASRIDPDHPVVKSAEKLGISIYGSSTLSNMVFAPFPAVKIGPGESKRSHKPDEFVYKKELEKGKEYYRKLINQYTGML